MLQLSPHIAILSRLSLFHLAAYFHKACRNLISLRGLQSCQVWLRLANILKDMERGQSVTRLVLAHEEDRMITYIMFPWEHKHKKMYFVLLQIQWQTCFDDSY